MIPSFFSFPGSAWQRSVSRLRRASGTTVRPAELTAASMADFARRSLRGVRDEAEPRREGLEGHEGARGGRDHAR